MDWHKVELFAVPPSMPHSLYSALPSLWERVECCHFLSVPNRPALAYNMNLVVGKPLGAAEVCHIAAIEFVMMSLVHIFRAAEQGVVGRQSNDPDGA